MGTIVRFPEGQRPSGGGRVVGADSGAGQRRSSFRWCGSSGRADKPSTASTAARTRLGPGRRRRANSPNVRHDQRSFMPSGRGGGAMRAVAGVLAGSPPAAPAATSDANGRRPILSPTCGTTGSGRGRQRPVPASALAAPAHRRGAAAARSRLSADRAALRPASAGTACWPSAASGAGPTPYPERTAYATDLMRDGLSLADGALFAG